MTTAITLVKGFNVEEVLRGYIVAALWSTNDESTPSGGVPFDENYSAEDLTDAARDQFRKNVVKFLELASETDLAHYRENKTIDPSQGTVGDYLGHDIWLDSQGHGVGFWDRDELAQDVRDRLSEVADELGEQHIYAGDDGRIHI
jgi:hypothetical protein